MLLVSGENGDSTDGVRRRWVVGYGAAQWTRVLSSPINNLSQANSRPISQVAERTCTITSRKSFVKEPRVHGLMCDVCIWGRVAGFGVGFDIAARVSLWRRRVVEICTNLVSHAYLLAWAAWVCKHMAFMCTAERDVARTEELFNPGSE
jgi:hypothetical protein